MSSTIDRLNTVFREVFADDDLSVTEATRADDIDGWDSLMHVTLMLNVEAEFGLRFKSTEVATLRDVGSLVKLIDAQ